MRRVIVAVGAGVIGLVLFGGAEQPIAGQRASRFDRETVNGRDVVAGEVLVKFRRRPVASELSLIQAEGDADEVRSIGRAGTILLRSRSRSTAALLSRLSGRPDIVYAEPNYIVRIGAEPNDPWFAELWALKNIGQAIGGAFGVSGADIHA